METVLVVIFTLLTGIVIIFQGCLAVGLPWGEASMGGKYPGVYPPKMRIVAIINMVILLVFIGVIWHYVGWLFSGSGHAIILWIMAVFFFANGIVNLLSPSKWEKIWAPVAFVQSVVCIAIVMLY